MRELVFAEPQTLTTELQPEVIRCLTYENIRDVDLELRQISEKNGPAYHSMHEAYGVLLEELDEVWDIARMKREDRPRNLLRKELVQIAACAIRAIHSIDNFVG